MQITLQVMQITFIKVPALAWGKCSLCLGFALISQEVLCCWWGSDLQKSHSAQVVLSCYEQTLWQLGGASAETGTPMAGRCVPQRKQDIIPAFEDHTGKRQKGGI